jgi:hypothetical protein
MSFPRFARGTEQGASIRFPLLTGGTCRRGLWSVIGTTPIAHSSCLRTITTGGTAIWVTGSFARGDTARLRGWRRTAVSRRSGRWARCRSRLTTRLCALAPSSARFKFCARSLPRCCCSPKGRCTATRSDCCRSSGRCTGWRAVCRRRRYCRWQSTSSRATTSTRART